MVDVLRVIGEAYEQYKKNWRKVISAFIILFLISIAFGIIDFVVKLPGQFTCENQRNTFIVILFCISPQILSITFGIIESLIGVVVILAVLKPFDEISRGAKVVSDWKSHFSPQLKNAIKIVIFKFLVFALLLVPLIIYIIFNIALFAAFASSKQDYRLFLTGSGLLLIFIFVATVILELIANFLLNFLEIEMVLGGKGLIEAAKKSANLVLGNLLNMIIYALIWFLISIGIGIVKLVLCCTVVLLPVIFIIDPFFITPIRLLSLVILWKEFKG